MLMMLKVLKVPVLLYTAKFNVKLRAESEVVRTYLLLLSISTPTKLLKNPQIQNLWPSSGDSTVLAIPSTQYIPPFSSPHHRNATVQHLSSRYYYIVV